MVFFEEGGVVKNKKVDNVYDVTEDDILVKYYVEEVDMDSPAELSHSIYYKILGIGNIHEFVYEIGLDASGYEAGNDVLEAVNLYNSSWQDIEIEEEKFFIN